MNREDLISLYRTDIQEYEIRISDLQWNIQNRKRRIAELEAEDAESPSKPSEFPEVGNYPMGYSKSATGAMEPRTVHVLHVTTGQKSESRAFWPDVAPVEPVDDIRTDPPYDR